MQKILFEHLQNSYYFKVQRSSGAGGQHVNKTNSSVTLYIIINKLNLPLEQILLIQEKLKNKLITDWDSQNQCEQKVLCIRCEEERDQKRNKDLSIKKALILLNSALYVAPKRYKTKPTRSSVKKRLNAKSIRSEVKKLRQKKQHDD